MSAKHREPNNPLSSHTTPLTRCQCHETFLVPQFGLRAPNIDGKPVVSVDELRAILTFNVAYDTGVLPGERHRIHPVGLLPDSLFHRSTTFRSRV